MNNLFDRCSSHFFPAHQGGQVLVQAPEGVAPVTGDEMDQLLSMHELSTIAGGWGSIDPI